MLIFALDLQNIKEIGCSSVNLYHVLVGTWLGICEVGDLELLRALFILFRARLLLLISARRLTLTYSLS